MNLKKILRKTIFKYILPKYNFITYIGLKKYDNLYSLMLTEINHQDEIYLNNNKEYVIRITGLNTENARMEIKEK